MWCFTRPPPRMIIPVFLAKMASVLMRRRSAEWVLSWGTPMARGDPSVQDPQGDTLTFHYIQHQPRALVGVEEDHVPKGAVSERRAQHRDLVLEPQHEHRQRGDGVTPHGDPVSPRSCHYRVHQPSVPSNRLTLGC